MMMKNNEILYQISKEKKEIIVKLKHVFTFILLTITLTTGCNNPNPSSSANLSTEEVSSNEVSSVESSIDYGDLQIDDLTVFINSNGLSTFATIDPVFTNEDAKEELTYTVLGSNASIINLSNNIVKATKKVNDLVTIKASSKHFETTFNVDVVYHDYNDNSSPLYSKFDTSRFNTTISSNMYKCRINLTSDDTLFIGDSFTDDYFILNFLNDWGVNLHVLSAGIGSTTSYHWEAKFDKIIGDKSPKNIVYHIGTNNFYDLKDNVEGTVSSIKRLLMYTKEKHPTSNIYFFEITQRANRAYYNQVNEANALLKEFCDQYSFFTYVDTDLPVHVLYDGIHPNYCGYMKMMEALIASNCEIVEKS
jgi:lysophospholipase L1-like esterase